MLLAASKSTTFFRFVKLCFTVEPVVFFNREERLCSPSLQESTVFFVSAKFHFACVSVNRFPSSRGAFMLHPAPQVNQFFASWPNRLAQCVIPVTREEQFKQTLHPCQHKKQISLSDIRKCPAGAIFAQLHARHHHALPLSIPPPTPSLTSAKQGNYISSYGELCLTCRPTLPIFRHTTN